VTPAPARELARAAPWLLLLAVVVAGAVGAGRGWHLLDQGYPLLLVDCVRAELVRASGALAPFGLLYLLVRAALVRPLPRRWGIAVAAGLALAPVVAAAGYRLNREAGFRPSELLEAYPLRCNLLLLAAAALVYAAIVLVLVRAARSERPARRSLVPALVVLGVAAVPFATLAVALPARTPAPDRPDVLLLLVDALRPDHLGVYGNPRDTSPAIDALAADGIVFRQGVSASTFTKTSVASLLTGRFPYQHGVYWGSRTDDPELPGAVTSDLLPAGEHTLAEALRPAGYLTAAWIQNSHLRGFMGFAQGFVEYHDQQGGIERIDRRFLRWLRGAAGHYPYFAYLHYIDLHDPYRPEPPYDAMFGTYAPLYDGIDLAEWGAYLEAMRQGRVTLSEAQVAQLEAYYDGQIRYVDDNVGRLLEELKRLGRYDDTLIVLTSDHGDGFYEHGFISHSTTPYEELARVPLIVKLPRRRHAGTEVAQQVRLVDVMPTLLDLLGRPIPPDVAGCSLRPLWSEGDGSPRDPGCAEAVIEIAEEGAEPVVAVRAGGFKYIHHEKARDELYDLARDPGETHNLIDAGLPVAEPLRARVQAVLAAREALASGGRIELDDATIRELKALGYVN
jgi:arylsulfatase A-like enzyme